MIYATNSSNLRIELIPVIGNAEQRQHPHDYGEDPATYHDVPRMLER